MEGLQNHISKQASDVWSSRILDFVRYAEGDVFQNDWSVRNSATHGDAEAGITKSCVITIAIWDRDKASH
jgi:hypothetical protein